MSKVEKRGNVRTDMSPCWLDKTGKASSGYGQIMFQLVAWNTHRYSYYIHNGCPELPTEMDVAHLCDNKECCNPEHLQLQEHKINCSAESLARVIPDKIRKVKKQGNWVAPSTAFEKGTGAGETNVKAVLTWEQVRAIRKKKQDGLQYGELKKMAVDYGISYATIQKIVSGETWKE